MIRTKGEAGTGNVVEAVKHQREIQAQIKKVGLMSKEEMVFYAKEIGVSVELLEMVKAHKRLPVVNFAAGGIATPADAALMMHLGSDGVFVGSGIFESANPEKTAKAIVQAVTFWEDSKKLAEISENLGEPMKGLEIDSLNVKMAIRDQ